jgi:hypothetical protein
VDYGPVQAGGNIKPRRIVKLASVNGDNVVTQASGNSAQMYGISDSRTRRPPIENLDDGYNAIAGENIRVFVVGDVAPVQAGGAFNAGDRLTSDSDGQAIASSGAGQFIIGVALQAALGIGSIVTCRISPDQTQS